MAMATKTRSSFAVWALHVALLAVQVLIATLVGHRFLGLPTEVMLNLLMCVFGMFAFALVLALVAFVRIWDVGLQGVSRAAVAMVLAMATFAWPAAYWPAYSKLPVLNDVTTDYITPPPFFAVAKLRSPQANSTTYPGIDFARLQADTYPMIKPLTVRRTAAEAFEITRKVVARRGWKVVNAAAPTPAGGPGLIEAVASTLILGFNDDVAIRIRDVGEATRIDVRSASRFGDHDFGRNANRVEDLLKQLEARLETGSQDPDFVAQQKARKAGKKKTKKKQVKKRQRPSA
ncbi:MAG: DUF1499 domain-containing protein, partial [Pseudomonadota bacterium]